MHLKSCLRDRGIFNSLVRKWSFPSHDAQTPEQPTCCREVLVGLIGLTGKNFSLPSPLLPSLLPPSLFLFPWCCPETVSFICYILRLPYPFSTAPPPPAHGAPGSCTCTIHTVLSLSVSFFLLQATALDFCLGCPGVFSSALEK